MWVPSWNVGALCSVRGLCTPHGTSSYLKPSRRLYEHQATVPCSCSRPRRTAVHPSPALDHHSIAAPEHSTALLRNAGTVVTVVLCGASTCVGECGGGGADGVWRPLWGTGLWGTLRNVETVWALVECS